MAVWHNLPSGGGKRALYDHVRGLVTRGHTVESWCPPTADQTYLPLSELVKEHVVPLFWPRDRSPLTREYGLVLEQIAALNRHCRECAEEINRGRFDLLLANTCVFFHTSSIAKYASVPAVLYLQEPYRALYEASPTLPWIASERSTGWWGSARGLKRRARSLLRLQAVRVQAREELENAQAFDSILVNSYYSRESVLRAYGVDAKVCYLGVDTKLFANRHETREDVAVGIGMFSPHKNIEFVIKALAQVRQPRPRLIWIGNNADFLYLEKLKTLAASSEVLFEPKLRIPDSELVSILNRAAVMVYAPRLEPFGFAPLEGNACGLPVVAVAEGGVRETVLDGKTGRLVDHDPQAAAKAIEYLLDHQDYARQLGENGCKLVAERWALEKAIDRLEERLAEVLLATTTMKQPFAGEVNR